MDSELQHFGSGCTDTTMKNDWLVQKRSYTVGMVEKEEGRGLAMEASQLERERELEVEHVHRW